MRPMTEIELWWAPGSCARATLVALEEIGEPFAAHLAGRNRATDLEFIAMNPKGKVPLLSIDGMLLTETLAILSYLARRYPDVKLLPADDPDALDALMTMSWIATGIQPMLAQLIFPGHFCPPGGEERIRAIAAATVRESFEIAERRLIGREWLYADWTMVDAYLSWAWFRAVGGGMDTTGLSSCAAHTVRCEARPSVARALDREEAIYAELRATGVISPAATPAQVSRISSVA
jgi:glutathione S-transferase